MALISSCPACSKHVSVPAAHPASKARCPLCQAEFELQSALDLAPPMLEILESPIGAQIDFSDASGNGVHAAAPAAMAAIGQGYAEESPSFSEALTFDAPHDEDAEELDTELEGKAPSFDDLMDEPASDDDALDLRETPADDSPFGLGGPMTADQAEMPAHEFGDESAPGVSAAASAAKRRKREPSFIGNLIGVVGGGVVGCGLAYFIVLWIGGPEKDFLELGPKLPKWMLPAAFSQTNTAAAMPLASNPTPQDLNEVKQAGGGEDLNVKVPPLPDQPADNATETKLPFAPDNPESAASDSPESPEDIANNLSSDPSAIEPSVPDATDSPADEPSGETSSGFEETATGTQVGPKEQAKYTVDDLVTVLNEADTLRRSVADADALEPAARNKLKTQYYRKLYRLGDVVTFATDADAAIADAASLLSELGADPSKLPEIGKAGVKWLSLDPTKRGQDKGVLLAGTVEEIAPSGEMHRMKILPSGEKTPVSIYSPTKPDLSQGDTVLVLGSIVTDPKESLHNFTDDETTVIWHGVSVKAGS